MNNYADDALVEKIADALAYATETTPFAELPAHIRDQFRIDARIALATIRNADKGGK